LGATVAVRMEVHMAILPIDIGGDLVVRIGRDAVRLSPSEGFRVAERLLRQSIRHMVVEAALDTEMPKRAPRRRKSH
jgi:hypothetical protein